MQDMGDILISIAKQNGWPIPTPLLDMFKRLPFPGKEGTHNEDDDDDKKEETSIMPQDYERVFWPNCSSMKGVVIHDPSHHSQAQTSGMWATKTSIGHERGKALMMEVLDIDSD